MTRRGFSLIEALVALAIASVCLLALFGLQQQLTSAQRRYEAALERADARRNLLALVRDLNPMAEPSGSSALPGGGRLRWESAPRTAPRQVLTLSGQPTGSVVRLYVVQASLFDAAGRARDTVSVERLGWRRLAAPVTGLRLGSSSPPPSAP